MTKASWFVVLIMAGTVFCGCEADNSSSDSSGETSAADGDAINLSSISWLGDNYSGATKTATLNSANMSGDTLSVSYQPYRWPTATVKTKVDAICCLFYERGGQVVGGKYDFWRAGGQGSKGLHNVRERYQGHSWPAAGAKVYTMNVSMNGSERSNIIQVSR